MKVKRKRALGAVLATVAALGVGVSVAGSASAAGPTVVIGWAFDGKGNMAPFDGPALAAATVRVKQVNARGGVQLKIITCDTQNNNPAKAKACALNLLGQGAKIIFTTCDVDFATPVVQEAINRGILAIAPCIGTDQMGPKRFGSKGALAFSFGNAAQDEGSAMAQWAYGKGWRTAGTGTNTLLVYFKNVVQAFEARFKQLGGKIVAHESYATGANNVNAAVSRLNGKCRRVRDLDGVRRAARVRDGDPRARQRDAHSQLLGRRRYLLGRRRHLELLRRDLRLRLRG